jgi:hypothetical protein
LCLFCVHVRGPDVSGERGERIGATASVDRDLCLYVKGA